MFGSETLEIAIGVIFVYILFSIICTAIREGIESFVKSRAAFLDVGLRTLLCDAEGKGLVKLLYNHPLIDGLFPGQYELQPKKDGTGRSLQPTQRELDREAMKAKVIHFRKHSLILWGRNLPTYIPSRNFALALMDIVYRGESSLKQEAALSVPDLRDKVATLKAEDSVKRALLVALDTSKEDLDTAQKNIEAWYESSMERVSGWYKRSTQKILFVIALLGALAMNINTIRIADYLHRNESARSTLVAQAGAAAKDSKNFGLEDPNAGAGGKGAGATSGSTSPTTGNSKAGGVIAAFAAENTLKIPIGWGDGWSLPRPGKASGAKPAAESASEEFSWWFDVLGPILGLLATAIAACLGAPFWFDTLNRLMVVRSTVKPAAPKEESESKTQSRAINNLATAIAQPPAGGGAAAAGNAGKEVIPPTGRKDLQLGGTDPLVKVVQTKLHIPLNDTFNAETEAAVRSFQIGRGLDPTGIVDQKTWLALDLVPIPKPPGG